MIKKDAHNDIYNRHDAQRDSETRGIAYRANKIIQSAEMNELQSLLHAKNRRVSDVMLREGDVVAGGVAKLDPNTGVLSIEASQVYLSGDIYSVPTFSGNISVSGEVVIGVWLTHNYITELDDVTLRNPAIGTRGAGEAGAWRIAIVAQWGLPDEPPHGSHQATAFYPVYKAKNGYLSAKEPPPHITSVTQAIAKYDVDSTGSEYIINGLMVRSVEGDATEKQTYLIDAGRARIGGFAIEYPAARRLTVDPEPKQMTVDAEPHLATGGSQRIWLNRQPVSQIERVRITAEKTVTLTHANFSDASDALPDAAVVKVLTVKQGSTIYDEGKDFILQTGELNWSLAGKEPATGSTYEVTYHYMRTATPSKIDHTGFTVAGAVDGTLILTTYTHHLPRLDRLCLDTDGEAQWLRGIPSQNNPLPPAVPDNLLLLATIEQDWVSPASVRPITQDGNRLVTMSDLNTHNRRLDYLTEMLAQTRLEQSSSMQEAGRKRGLFADPFLSDQFRDLGSAQTAVVGGGLMQLNITPTAHWLSLPEALSLPANTEAVIDQPASTGCMKINPYSAFDVMPALVNLSPDVDRWTVTKQAITQADSAKIMIRAAQWARTAKPSSSLTLLSADSDEATYCRPITIAVTVAGFGAGELLKSVTFDDVPVTAMGQVKADSDGELTFTITIPENVPAGTKRVHVVGRGGTRGDAYFIAEGKIITENFKRTRFSYRKYDPLAQTFTLSELRQVAAVEIGLCKTGSRPVRVQIRETLVGIPTQAILGEAVLSASDQKKGLNTFVFESPVSLAANVEYAVVVLSDESTPAVEIATLGNFDESTQSWVTAQAYTVGALLSSSNASTWTPHNDKDLRFKLLATKYTQQSRVVTIGSLDVTDISDLAVFFTREIIGGGDAVTITADLPGGETLTFTDAQTHAFNHLVTGNIVFKAHLRGTQTTAPILHKHVQVLTGQIQAHGSYISRAIPAGSNCRVRVLIDAFLPAGSQLNVKRRLSTSSPWENLMRVNDRRLDDGKVELTYETTANITANSVQVALDLSGKAGARATLSNLRVMVIED